MDMETRSAPPAFRSKLTSRLRGYQAEIQKLKKDLVRLLGLGLPSGWGLSLTFVHGSAPADRVQRERRGGPFGAL